MFPDTVSNDVVDAGYGHLKLGGNLLKLDTTGAQASHFTNIVCCHSRRFPFEKAFPLCLPTVPLSERIEAGINSVKRVSARSHVFDIPKPVVGLVPVDVVDLHPFRARPEEGSCNESMNLVGAMAAPCAAGQIEARIAPDEACLTSSHCADPADRTTVAYFIPILVTRYWPPSFGGTHALKLTRRDNARKAHVQVEGITIAAARAGRF